MWVRKEVGLGTRKITSIFIGFRKGRQEKLPNVETYRKKHSAVEIV